MELNIPEDLLESIQRLREEWNEATDIPNPSFWGEGVTAYQFWLESRLVYRCRLIAELTYERNRWAELYRKAEAELATAKQLEADFLYSRNKWHMLCNHFSYKPEKSCVATIADRLERAEAERDRLEQENKRLKERISFWRREYGAFGHLSGQTLVEMDVAARAEQEKGAK